MRPRFKAASTTKTTATRTGLRTRRARSPWATAVCAGLILWAYAIVPAANTANAANKVLISHPATASVHAAKMQIGADIPPPFGYVEFCQRFPRDCRSTANDTTPIYLNSEKRTQLDAVNLAVNKAIQPFRDIDLYGTEEHWTYPQSAGDCEDYALLKMQHLQRLGWPKSALLLSVVYDELGEPHTILLVVTENGEFVLDNKNNVVKEWNTTRYKWLMRQSTENPMRWVRIIG